MNKNAGIRNNKGWIAGSRCSMQSYILAYCQCKRETLIAFVLNRGETLPLRCTRRPAVESNLKLNNH